MNMPAKLPAWSFSVVDMFEQCAYKYYRLKVAKDVKDSGNQANRQGDLKHKMLDAYIKTGAPFPPGYEKLKPLADAVLAGDGEVKSEIKFTLNPQYIATDWFADDAWLRVIVDVVKTRGPVMWMGDWKDGKVKDESWQLMLFACVGFALYPQIQTIATSFIWMNHIDTRTGHVKRTDKVFQRSEMRAMWESALAHYNRLLEAYATGNFPPNPTGLCGWCPVNAQGQCVYTTKKYVGG